MSATIVELAQENRQMHEALASAEDTVLEQSALLILADQRHRELGDLLDRSRDEVRAARREVLRLRAALQKEEARTAYWQAAATAIHPERESEPAR